MKMQKGRHIEDGSDNRQYNRAPQATTRFCCCCFRLCAIVSEGVHQGNRGGLTGGPAVSGEDMMMRKGRHMEDGSEFNHQTTGSTEHHRQPAHYVPHLLGTCASP